MKRNSTISPENEEQNETVGYSGEDTNDQTQVELQVGFNPDFLRENGFNVIEYLSRGKYGQVYSAVGNELAIRFYPIDQIPEGGVIGENVWQSGNQLYAETSLEGVQVAIKYIPPPEPQPWDDLDDKSDRLQLGAVGGTSGLICSDFAERIGHPLEEFRKLMKLNDTNLVEVYNVLEDNEMGVYIVMEFCEMNLKQWIEGMHENGVRLDDRSIEIFLCQLIDTLEYLHANNVTHNDLHCGNVMVTEDDEGMVRMKITDFGESQYFSDFNSPVADIKGLGFLLKHVLSLHDPEHPEFKGALDDFIYTCVKGVFSNMDEVKKEFQYMRELLKTEE